MKSVFRKIDEISPLISIVLPTYNGEQFISCAINSIIQQDYTNWELIVVDDCSVDGTYNILQQFVGKDERIKVIRNNENKKLPTSLNIGFEQCCGKYYTWTSDDNIMRKNMLTTFVDFLEKNKNIDMVYSNYSQINCKGEIIHICELEKPLLLATRNVCGAAFLYRSQIAKLVGDYDRELFLAEDYDYWLRIYCEGKIAHINDDLYLYRVHENSLSERKKNEIIRQTFNALQKNKSKLLQTKYYGLKKRFIYDGLLLYADQEQKNLIWKEININFPMYTIRNKILKSELFNRAQVKYEERNESEKRTKKQGSE